MSGEQLREELARIADGAPEVHVPDDLFGRGRRATVRTRVLAGAAAVACLALIVGVGTTVLRHDDGAQVVDGDVRTRLGVPDHLYVPPSYETERDGDGSWSSDLLSDDLAIGIGAAAYVTDTGLPVVVDAKTGGYHLLDLPGVTTAGPIASGSVSLSPDGRQLAWGWAGDASAQPRPSGIRIADLETGQVSEVRLDGTRAVLVGSLAWSPNSMWLAWEGREMREWRDQAIRPADRSIGGVIGADRTTSSRAVLAGKDATTVTRGREEISDGNAPSVVAVADDGRLAAVVGWSYYVDGERGRLVEDVNRRIGGLWFDGSALLGLEYFEDEPDGTQVRVLPRGDTFGPFGATPEPEALGLVAPRLLLLRSSQPEGDGPVKLARWGREGSGWDVAIEVDPGVHGLSLAYELMDPADPTVGRPEPDWPWSTERKVAVYGGSALLVVLLAGGFWLLWRRSAR